MNAEWVDTFKETGSYVDAGRTGLSAAAPAGGGKAGEEKKGGEARVMYSGWRSAEDAKYEKPTYKRSQWIEHSASKPNARLRSRPGYPAKLLGDDGGGGGCCTLQ